MIKVFTKKFKGKDIKRVIAFGRIYYVPKQAITQVGRTKLGIPIVHFVMLKRILSKVVFAIISQEKNKNINATTVIAFLFLTMLSGK